MPSDAAQSAAEGQRLHPSSLLFNIGGYTWTILLPGLLVLLFAVGDPEDAWFMVAFVPAVLYSLLRYFTLRYALTGSELVVREGVLFRSLRHVPYARIHNVDTVQNPLHRVFGVVEVRIETAAGKEPEAVLKVVSTEQLEEIRRGIFAGRGRVGAREAGGGRGEEAAGADGPPGESAPGAGAEPAAGRPFFRMRLSDVLLFGFLSQRGLAYFAGALYLAAEFDVFEKVQERFQLDPQATVESFAERAAWPSSWVWAGVGLALLAVLQVLTSVWALLTLYGFRLERSGEDLRATCGLWTRQTATVPRHRIQRLMVQELPLLRLSLLLSVRVATAGGDSTEESQIARKWLLPAAPAAALPRVLAEVQPEVRLDEVRWEPVHPRARVRMTRRWLAAFALADAVLVFNVGPWGLSALALLVPLAVLLAALRQRRLGWALAGGVALARDGFLGIRRTAVRFSKIQSVSLVQTPFDRRFRMATLRVATAGPGGAIGGFTVPYLPLRTARRLARRLRDEAAAREFRW